MSHFLTEAQDLIKKAEKSLKTSMLGLKFSPDYDSAADYYTKAATAYKNGKQMDLAVSSYLKAAECYEQNKSLYHAARVYENSAVLYKQKKDFENFEQYILKASDLALECGQLESAITTLDKGSKMVEFDRPEATAKMMEKAAQICIMTDNLLSRIEYLYKAASCYSRLGQFDKACHLLRGSLDTAQECGKSTSHISKAVLSLTIMAIKSGDYVAARKCYERGLTFSIFNGSMEGGCARELLNAYDARDHEEFNRIKDSSEMRNSCDTNFYQVVQGLNVPGAPIVDSNEALSDEQGAHDNEEAVDDLC